MKKKGTCDWFCCEWMNEERVKKCVKWELNKTDFQFRVWEMFGECQWNKTRYLLVNYLLLCLFNHNKK